MKFILTTAAAVLLAILGQYLVVKNWGIGDRFLGGYFTAAIVSFYLEKAAKL